MIIQLLPCLYTVDGHIVYDFKVKYILLFINYYKIMLIFKIDVQLWNTLVVIIKPYVPHYIEYGRVNNV